MNELKIEYLGLSDLKGYENNTRTHSEEQITQIANSIQEFGFTNPVLIDENNVIVAGHGRIEASKVLGLKKVPTIKLKGLSDTQIKALVIADNQIALNAGWDYASLKMELNELDEEGFDLGLVGFDDIELGTILDDEDFIEPETDGLAEKKEKYDNAELKRIVLMYNSDDFEEVNQLAEQVLEELKLEDNSALFKFLVENYIGDNRIEDNQG